MSKLRIAEIFSSIQGEGICSGTPSTFVRVSGCNLRCVWCDTPYASWHPEGPVISVPEILERMDQRHVVLTGGEPMLFEAIEALAKALHERGHVITIETAGTVFRELPCDLMSISPKLANSTPGPEAGEGWADRHEATRSDLEPLRELVRRYNVQLKFVVDLELALTLQVNEIQSLLAKLPHVVPERVLLMPKGTDAVSLRRDLRLLIAPCMNNGWRLSPRLHIDLFGNVRGT